MLIGFPQDEGVRRNHGRPGAAEAPQAIRQWLYCLTSGDPLSKSDLASSPPLDAGNVRIDSDLEATQGALGEVVAGVLAAGALPIVLGGGHETAFGHYLGYAALERPVGVINIDAHLDVRPSIGARGHSGSPFRQMLEHPSHPLPGQRYVCLGAQPHSVSRDHWRYVEEHGGVVRWAAAIGAGLATAFLHERDRLAAAGCSVYLSIDADAVRAADVPGVSAPNPTGLAGDEVIACARAAGQSAQVSSLDLVEINPLFDRDHQSARWAAVVVWNFLMGLAERSMKDAQ